MKPRTYYYVYLMSNKHNTVLYTFVHNSPINFVDLVGWDAIVLNDPRGANRQGHQAIAIGDNNKGWHYYSKEGYSNPSVHRYYTNLTDLFNGVDVSHQYATQAERYLRKFLVKTTESQDQKMKMYATNHYRDSYSLIGNHCADLVTNIMHSAGIKTGNSPFMNSPNEAFLNIVEDNSK